MSPNRKKVYSHMTCNMPIVGFTTCHRSLYLRNTMRRTHRDLMMCLQKLSNYILVHTYLGCVFLFPHRDILGYHNRTP